MRTPSARIRNAQAGGAPGSSVTINLFSWTKDSQGARVKLGTKQSIASVVCSVQVGEPRTFVDPETNRWQTEVPITFRLNQDYGQQPLDQVVWVNGATGRTHTCSVIGTSDGGGRGYTTVIHTIERL